MKTRIITTVITLFLSMMFMTVHSYAGTEDEAYLDEILSKYQWGALEPVYGTDTNIIEFMKRDLAAKGYSGTEVALISIEGVRTSGGVDIKENGDISYFYADPMKVNLEPYYNMPYGSLDVTFELTRGGATATLKKKVHLYWDMVRLKESLTDQILDNIIWDAIKGTNNSVEDVKDDMNLPRYLGGENGGKTLAEIKWTSNDTEAIAISDGSDPIYGDYNAAVKQGLTDRTVTLTAGMDYKKTNNDRERNEISKLKKEITVTVPAMDAEAIRAKMQQELNAGYTVEKITDFISREKVDPESIKGDIQLLTPKNTGVPKYDQYRFSVTSDNEDVAEINGYRAVIYRPLPGEDVEKLTLTVRMALRSNENIYVEKEIPLTVTALTTAEIEEAGQLMEKAVEAYWDGIRGENTDRGSVTKDLRAFQEVNLDDKGNARHVYQKEEETGTGIVPDTHVEDPDGSSDEQYASFYSSRPGIIQHGNPRILSRPEYDTEVTVESYLNHRIFAKYYRKYRDAGDDENAALFEDLYRRYASVNLIVSGEKGEDPDKDRKYHIDFSVKGADGEVWIDLKDMEIKKGGTAWDIVNSGISEKGYAIEGSTSYISGIGKPDGSYLRERDHGENSGWMYAVNGVLPDVPLYQYVLSDEDRIVLFYVKDYTNIDLCAVDEHKWGEWEVTKKATAKAPGEEQRTCSRGHIETRAIPKAASPTGKVTILNTIANSVKKTNDVVWDKSKVKGATAYEINWRARGTTAWAGRTVGNGVRGTTSGLTVRGMYEIRVRPVKAETERTATVYGTCSDTVYRYFHTTEKIRLASKSKGSFTMSWKKNPQATSYQVLYTTDKNGRGAAQNIRTAGASSTSITVRDIKVNGKTQKLRSGTTYYVQIREIRKVGNISYIGNISIPVKVKIR